MIIIDLIFRLSIFIWIIYAFFIIYHFVRFGIGRQPKILAFWFLAGGFFLLSLTLFAFEEVRWVNLIQYVSNIFIFQ